MASDDPRDATDLQVAGVLHDARQMLSVITGRVDLLLARAGGADKRDLLAIRLAADDAAAVLARLGGKPVAHARTAAMARTAAEAALLAWPQDEAAWAWDCRIPDEAAAAVAPQVLREVLVNLLLNAREALGRGGRVSLTAARAGDRWSLRVVDDGPGVAAALVPDLFAAGAGTSGEPGRGIGLAGCRDLLRTHGGDLRYEPGDAGSTFVVDLPAAEPAPGVTGADPDLEVLVVDDETGVREMLGDLIGTLGYRVRSHRDGTSALADTAAAPGVAFIDRNLPGLAGPELATRLRVVHPALAVVGMTGWDGDRGADQPAFEGADFVVRKPLGLDKIRELLADAGRCHRERRDGHAEA